jgi:lambda repressor-like predicted transcriptional regulator
MPHGNAIDARLADELTGQEKLRALFKSKGWTYQNYARERGFWPEQVKMTLHGTRPYPEVRECLAADLELSRAEIDALIDGPAKAEVA